MTTQTKSEAAVFRDAIAVLREARKLLKRGWCQGAPARDAEGLSVGELKPTACRWCLLGAISFASRGEPALYRKAEKILRVATGWEMLALWNDVINRTQAEVLAAVDRAIALGERELAKLEGGER